MKGFLSAIICLVILLISSIYMFNYIEKTSSIVDKQIDEAIQCLLDNDIEAASELFKNTEKQTIEYTSKWEFMVNHNVLDYIGSAVYTAKGYLLHKDIDSAIATLYELKFHISNMYNREKFTLTNIF